jgi:predicted AAA+ superfamily ATPase
MYTPYEIYLTIEADKLRRTKTYNDLIRCAYMTVYFDRQKKMPKLDDFIAKEENEYMPKEKTTEKNKEQAFLNELKALNAALGGKVV